MLPDDQRAPMPVTRPDTEARGHKVLCRCEVCNRSESRRWKQLGIRERSRS